ncbi:hypothetical protein [Lentzea sp. CA-135723]|uniref:hypothetical protein n=1 Tax=Lentzea sp. CA-135723 TaxID=3239950 RepID=UPI003D8AEE54
MTKKIAAALVALAFSTGGLALVAAPASAASCSVQNVRGSGGHNGAAVTCYDLGTFQASARCRRTDNGFQYTHFGPMVGQGRTSTVWCDLNAVVVSATGINI